MRTAIFAVGFLLLSASALFAQAPQKAVLLIHGGAGVLTDAEMKELGLTRADFEKALAESLAAGFKAMQGEGKTAVDGVEAAIRVMEDSPLFNAGKGAVLTADGRAELDASIMEGRIEGSGEGKKDPRKRAGAVTGVHHVKNPISAARAVMEMPDSRHMLLAGEGAERFVFSEANLKKYNQERVSNTYFWTDRRVAEIRKKEPKLITMSPKPVEKFGTVGASAVVNGHLAAGTSTGGLTGKWPGRIGDSPIIGAGTYADDRACGVSCTGTGELFIRHAIAHDVVARMIYKKIGVVEAASEAAAQLPDDDDGVGGFIALGADGIYRGYVTAKGEIYVALLAKEEWKRVK
jgi:L-asparaginase / beta-aspartyl-peptidase